MIQQQLENGGGASGTNKSTPNKKVGVHKKKKSESKVLFCLCVPLDLRSGKGERWLKCS